MATVALNTEHGLSDIKDRLMNLAVDNKAVAKVKQAVVFGLVWTAAFHLLGYAKISGKSGVVLNPLISGVNRVNGLVLSGIVSGLVLATISACKGIGASLLKGLAGAASLGGSSLWGLSKRLLGGNKGTANGSADATRQSTASQTLGKADRDKPPVSAPNPLESTEKLVEEFVNEQTSAADAVSLFPTEEELVEQFLAQVESPLGDLDAVVDEFLAGQTEEQAELNAILEDALSDLSSSGLELSPEELELDKLFEEMIKEETGQLGNGAVGTSDQLVAEFEPSKGQLDIPQPTLDGFEEAFSETLGNQAFDPASMVGEFTRASTTTKWAEEFASQNLVQDFMTEQLVDDFNKQNQGSKLPYVAGIVAIMGGLGVAYKYNLWGMKDKTDSMAAEVQKRWSGEAES